MSVYGLELDDFTADDMTVVQGPRKTGSGRAGDGIEPTPPRFLGRYVIVAELGVGGMGRVFRGYDPQLDREVALKLLRRVTRAARARLLREAQAMAKLCHPNVLPVYDVATEGSHLFIAMELVRGESLREWLDVGPHPWWEVVEVLTAAGRGLEAAHRAGLVHRDFKPGNVLLGDDGRVRVMDFGLVRGTPSHSIEVAAHASASGICRLEESASGIFVRRLRPSDSYDHLASFGDDLTQHGTVVGTPAYMAPEQHLGQAADPRSDQYGFCVTLWEALYGRRPFHTEHADEWYHVKSTARPRVDPERGVPRWLHAVLLRGLAPRACDRHPTMSALLHALSQGRRRRCRVGGLVLGSVLGLAGVGVGVHQAAQPPDLCSGAERKLEGIWDAEAATVVEHAVLSSGVSYAAHTWARVAPQLDDYAMRWRAAHVDACEATHVRGEQVEGVMDARMRCLDERRRGLKALVHTLADADAKVVERAVLAVGELPSIEPCADPDYVRAQALPPDDATPTAELAAVVDELARIKALVDAGRAMQARADAHAALEHAQALGHAPLEAEASFLVGIVEDELGHYEECRQHLEQAYFLAQHEGLDALQARAAIQLIHVVGNLMGLPEEGEKWERFSRATLHRVHDPLIEAAYLNNAGLLAGDRGHRGIAIAKLERALVLREQHLGAEHPLVASVINNLALMHDDEGEYEQAVTLHERALALRERLLGPDHPHVATSLLNLSTVHRSRAHYDRALALQLRAHAIYLQAYGPQHPHTAGTLVNLGTIYESMEQPERALERYTAALRLIEQAHGPQHPHVAGTLINMGNVYKALGDRGLALEHYERALEIFEKTLGPEDAMVSLALVNLGALAYDEGQLDVATAHLRRALTIARATMGPKHPRVALIYATQALVHAAQGRPDDAVRLHGQALALRREGLGARHPETTSSLRALGRALLDAGDAAAAVEPLQEAIETLRGQDDQAALLHETRFLLARAWWETGDRHGEARALALQARAGLSAQPGDHGVVIEELDQWLATHERAREQRRRG